MKVLFERQRITKDGFTYGSIAFIFEPRDLFVGVFYDHKPTMSYAFSDAPRVVTERTIYYVFFTLALRTRKILV